MHNITPFIVHVYTNTYTYILIITLDYGPSVGRGCTQQTRLTGRGLGVHHHRYVYIHIQIKYACV